MNSYFVAGLAANAAVKGRLASATSADSVLGLESHIISGNLWELFKFASLSDQAIVLDLSQVPNGGFEDDANGAAPSGGWVQENGTPLVTTADPDEGAKSLELDSANESGYIDIEVVAGKKYRYECALHGDGTAAVRAEVIDLFTGKYKTTASETSWTATQTFLAQRTTGSYGTTTQNMVFDSHAPGRSDRTIVRLRFSRPGSVSGSAYVDDVRLYPYVDFASMHYFRHPDSVVVTIGADESVGGPFTEQTTLPTKGLRKYSKFTPSQSDPFRFWQILFDGDCFAGRPAEFGQLVLAEVSSFARAPFFPRPTGRSMPSVDAESDTAIFRTPKLPDGRLSVGLRFGANATGLAQAIEQFYMASSYGAEPVVVVPDDSRDEIIYGRLPREVVANLRVGRTDIQGTIVEDPFPAGTK